MTFYSSKQTGIRVVRAYEVVMSELSINPTITVLFDKLNLSTDSAVSNSTSTKTLSTTSQQTEISVDAETNHFLMLKDNINEAGYLFSSVSVTTSNLSKIGDYLANIKENVEQRQSVELDTEPLTFNISSLRKEPLLIRIR